MLKTPPRPLLALLLLILVAVTASGCELAQGIFKAGFWVGIVIAVVVVGGLFALMARLRG
jgi:hypothetical protein